MMRDELGVSRLRKKMIEGDSAVLDKCYAQRHPRIYKEERSEEEEECQGWVGRRGIFRDPSSIINSQGARSGW